MQPTRKNSIGKIFENASRNPILLGLGVGLYPLTFYYSRNFGMINSWEQLGYFSLLFVIVPIIFFSILKWLSSLSIMGKWAKYVFPFFNIFLFFFFIKIILYTAMERKIIVGIFIGSCLIAYFLHKYFKKWLMVQLVLALIGVIGLIPTITKYLNYSSEWTLQPDTIENIQFQKRPNIYYIQPDGYVNFSELESGYYNVDNPSLKDFLEENDFKNYPNFRSNYTSTLTSNSATFMMKHHLYNMDTGYAEIINGRRNIVSKNPVLTIFRNNGYKTHFITEHPYLMVNRPKIGYDFTNFQYSEIPYKTTGFNVAREVYPDLENAIASKSDNGNFFFIEIFEPSHISTTKAASKGKEKEREIWLKKMEIANMKLKKMVNLIVEKDPNALIMIMADHGGYVGMDYTQAVYKKNNDPDFVYSIFSAILSIRWPNKEVPNIDSNFKSCINVFRILFSYMGNEEKYLKNLQKDASYLVLKEDTPEGVYEYIDENGDVVCKKI